MASPLALLVAVLVICAAATHFVDGHTCSAGWATCSSGRFCKTNVLSDPNNCGKCGTKCAGGPHALGKCRMGNCSIECERKTGWRDCDGNQHNGCEADTQNNKKHCGACARECGAPSNFVASCVKGRCRKECKFGYTQCGESCVKVASDVSNCGRCWRACQAPANGTAVCVGGACRVNCNLGFTKCGGKCVNLNEDVDHCGSCGNGCSTPANGKASCNAGECGAECNDGFTNCNGKCSDLNEVDHCGSCGTGCSSTLTNGKALCVAGACEAQCNKGFTIALRFADACVAECDVDFSKCNGTCSNLLEDVDNCGSCGNGCSTPNGNASCVDGACEVECDVGFTKCNGKCSNLYDSKHCGSCNFSCPDVVENGHYICGSLGGTHFGPPFCILVCDSKYSSCGGSNLMCCPAEPSGSD